MGPFQVLSATVDAQEMSANKTTNPSDPQIPDKWRTPALFLVSMLALFLEMVMIYFLLSTFSFTNA